MLRTTARILPVIAVDDVCSYPPNNPIHHRPKVVIPILSKDSATFEHILTPPLVVKAGTLWRLVKTVALLTGSLVGYRCYQPCPHAPACRGATDCKQNGQTEERRLGDVGEAGFPIFLDSSDHFLCYLS